jgi:hypothetical protein
MEPSAYCLLRETILPERASKTELFGFATLRHWAVVLAQ